MEPLEFSHTADGNEHWYNNFGTVFDSLVKVEYLSAYSITQHADS